MTAAAVDPAHVMQVATGFAASEVVLSAVELDRFTALGKGATTGEELAGAATAGMARK